MEGALSVDVPSAAEGSRVATPAVERELVFDMIRRGLPLVGVLVVAAGLLRGEDGVASALFGAGVAIANLLLAACSVAAAARISPVVLAAVTMTGFVVRLALVTVAVLAVRDQPWVDPVTLGATLVITHLGLLVAEVRHVSASLAFPALKPRR